MLSSARSQPSMAWRAAATPSAASRLAGCSTPLPLDRPPADDAAAAARLRESAEAHGLTAYRRLSDTLDEDRRGGGDDRFRHRRDPEERVARHRRAAVRPAPEDLDVELPTTGDQRDQSRNVAVVDVRRQHVAQPPEPCLRETAARHGLDRTKGSRRLAG